MKLLKKNFGFCFAALFFSLGGVLNSFASVRSDRITLQGAEVKSSVLQEVHMTAAHLKLFESLRKAEASADWAECAKIAPKAFEAENSLQGWVLLTWLRCARRQADKATASPAASATVAPKSAKTNPQGGKIKNVWSILKQPFKQIEKRPSFLERGPWRQLLFQEWIRSHLDSLEVEWLGASGKMGVEKTGKNLLEDSYLKLRVLQGYQDRLSKEQKARVWNLFGQLSNFQKEWAQAVQFFQLSLNEKEARPTRERMSVALSKLPSKAQPLEKGESAVQFDLLAEDEKAAEERFLNSQKINDKINTIEDGVNYLNLFPNGRRSKVIADKILEHHLALASMAEANEANKSLVEKSQKILSKLDPYRCLEWARVLHRKADFENALFFSETALRGLGTTSLASAAYFIAGRSAHFLNRTAKARDFYEKYLQKHSGGEDAVEVQFRLALLHLREGQYSSAVAQLEKLLLLKNKDRYELSARYWLTRALQWGQNPRASTEANAILQKFPFSYYGMILRSEQNASKTLSRDELALGTSKLDPAVVFWTEEQTEALSRAQKLSQAGWIAEAQLEVQELGLPSADPNLMVLMSQRWLSMAAISPAIKLANEAADLDSQFRSAQWLFPTYPKLFQERVEQEASNYSMSPYLVWSLIRQESAFFVRATSTSNAMGLMQLIPPTAAEVIADLKLETRLGRLTVPDDVYDPDINIRLGTYYLAKMLRQFSASVPVALAAYNAGPQRVGIFTKLRPEMLKPESVPAGFEMMWVDELPWYETSFYVKAILRNSMIYLLQEKGKVDVAPNFWKSFLRENWQTSTNVKGVGVRARAQSLDSRSR